MAVFDVWMEWVWLFLNLHDALSLPSSFCTRGYMVWKMMMFEWILDGCLVLGNLWYANAVILAISESPCTGKPSSSFCYRENIVWKMLVEEFQDGCIVHCHLWCVNGIIYANSELYMLPEVFHSAFTQENIWFERSWLKNSKMAVKGMAIFSVWMGLISYSESTYYQKSSIKVLNKRIYGLEEDVGWRIPRCLDSAWKSLMCERGDFSYFWVSYCPKHSINFLIKRIYGLTDVGWRISRWLFSAQSS